jgi:hypothetical protein
VAQRVGRGIALLMTAALEGGEWSAARPSRTLRSEKTRYPFYRRLGGPYGRTGLAENLVPTGIRSRTVQTIVSHYTDCAPAHTNKVYDTVLNVRATCSEIGNLQQRVRL